MEIEAEDFINGRYQVIRCLGRGAMGTVYLVEDMIKENRRVALKVLNSENLDDPDTWSKGEYEALTRLRHPNLARVYDFARVQGSDDFYIVSEFIPGQDLFTATRNIEFEELLDILAQICRALEYIHTQGYVHFDIKPDNILVTRTKIVGHDDGSKVQWNPNIPTGSESGKGPPQVKLIDFGLAEQISGTFNFAIKGTINYVAPEIIRGQTPDKRADLYSLGVTTYQILTGRLPFVGEGGNFVPRESTNWREITRRGLERQPQWLIDILLKLFESDPALRYQSAREIIQAVNAGAGRHYQVETAETQLSYLYSSRLVGRRQELNRIKEEAESIFSNPMGAGQEKLSSGDTSVVSRLLRDRKRTPLYLISGEIGSGKSRLMEEFSHYLKMREIPIHMGNCYETSHDPYQPFREIIEQKALHLGLESEVFLKHGACLRRLGPKLRVGDETDGDRGFRPDKERLYFMESLANFLIDAAVARPDVICVNNLHWADEASVDLLACLIERIVKAEAELPCGIPLMMLGTMRTDEALPESLRTVITSLREEERIREIPVRRFTRAQIAELIHGMLQLEEIPAPFLDRLEERTSGNPLFIVETLKGLQEEGIITRHGNAWRIRTDGDLSRVEIPHGIEAILLRRVRMLDVQQQRVLEALAVYDKPMSAKLLERFPEFQESNVMMGLRDLENRGMVLKTLDSGRVLFSISQPKLREIVYENLEEDRRRALHGGVADSLSEEYSGQEKEILEDLAYHYQRSDRVGKALEFTVMAGDMMRTIFAHDRAVEHYQHVIRQTEGTPRYRRIWFETHESIGDIGTISGNFELAQESYETLLNFDLDDDSVAQVDRARILRKKGKLDEIQGEYDKALRCYKAARDLLDHEDSPEAWLSEKIRVYNAIGWIYVCMEKYDKAMTIAVDALRMIEGTEERGEHAMIFSTIGSANYFKGNLQQAIEFHTRALEIRENLENIPEMIISLNNLGDAYLETGEYVEALKHYEQAFASANDVGDAFGRAMALHHLADAYFALGDDSRAEGYLQESLNLSRHYRMRFLNTQNYLLRGKLRRRQDDLAKSEGDLFRALGVFAKQGSRWHLSRCLIEVAAVQRIRNNNEEALRLVREAITNAHVLNVANMEARARLLELRIMREQNEEVLELNQRLDLIAHALEGSTKVELLGEVEMERGEVFLKMREPDKAREAFRRAENYFRDVADRLPTEHRESYLALHQVTCAGRESPEIREVPGDAAPESVEKPKPARSLGSRASTELSSEQSELLRVASLLQELGQAGHSPVFINKVLNCLIQATGAEEGFLLIRNGDEVRIFTALDRKGEPIRRPGSRICLEALEDSWEENEAILAEKILDHPGVQSYDSFYRNNISSVAILPMRTEGISRGALYLNNPKQEHLSGSMGSSVLQAYLNLITLILPRPIPA